MPIRLYDRALKVHITQTLLTLLQLALQRLRAPTSTPVADVVHVKNSLYSFYIVYECMSRACALLLNACTCIRPVLCTIYQSVANT
jgi:hypothetical protein